MRLSHESLQQLVGLYTVFCYWVDPLPENINYSIKNCCPVLFLSLCLATLATLFKANLALFCAFLSPFHSVSSLIKQFPQLSSEPGLIVTVPVDFSGWNADLFPKE